MNRDNIHTDPKGHSVLIAATPVGSPSDIAVSLLTGGSDRPYVFGVTQMLLSNQIAVDMIGSDELDFPELRGKPGLNFLNLRGSLETSASFGDKAFRITRYYAKLLFYAFSAQPKLFHILWNNRIEALDRTVLMLYYRLLRKKIVLTVHNVNMARRDSRDTRFNRFTLRIQYLLAHQLFVHTDQMKTQLVDEFGIRSQRITVIPFGINNAVPHTSLSSAEAKNKLGLRSDERALLFFGRITPYKGLDYLISAFRQMALREENYRLIIAGRPDRCEEYWKMLCARIGEEIPAARILLKEGFIPDEEVETYFKAADVLVLPYRDIFQSGVLFLGQSFGVPVLAADVGCFREDVVEDDTGFLFKSEDANDMVRAMERYFASDLFRDLVATRQIIQSRAAERHSWDRVGEITVNVYSNLLHVSSVRKAAASEMAVNSLDIKTP